ncbi:MAG: ABC-2 transporter permease [Candidatus Aminicenantes bacterium]|nr:ABC-2 transporter permease [Candidatus Aminicenantes bacterium]
MHGTLRHLIRLEFLMSRKALLIMLGFAAACLAWAAAYFPSPRLYIVMVSFIIGLSLPVAVHGREDKFKTSSLLCSLPVRRSSVVLAKFTATWMALGAGYLFAVAVVAVLPFAKFPFREILTVREALLALALTSLAFAFVLPFIIRFGITGLMIGLVATQLLGVLLFTSALLFGRTNNPFRFVLDTAIKALKSLFHLKPTPGYLALLAVAVIAINAGSLLLARRVYLRREL